MTKEEVIKDLIDMAKNGANNPLDAYCDSCSCLTCPFHSDENGECPDELVGELIGRLIKAEEKKETNLEHYIIRNGVSIAREHDVEVWEFRFKKGTEKQFFDANIKSVLDWLLSPYDPPKYKLSQFEYDLIDSYFDTTTRRIKDFWALKNMQDKGYFKGIPTDISIKNILDNCEVIEE